jgi:trans-4-hydroxy-L-proline dehydratase
MSELRGEALEAAKKVSLFAGNYPLKEGSYHSNPNYERLLSQGLKDYRQRIISKMNVVDYKKESYEIYQALLVVIAGIEELTFRIVNYLDSLHFNDTEKEENRRALIEAFSIIPMKSAKSFKQAVIVANLFFYLDGGDNLGRVDHYLNSYYVKDEENGIITRDKAKEFLTALWDRVEMLGGWNVCIGGSNAEKKDLSNEITIMCLETAKGRRRPNLTLKIHDTTPNRVWETAMDCVSGGSGLPAFYGEKNILQGLKNCGIEIEDRDTPYLAFGGCTETLIDGRSNIGTNDYILNTLNLLEKTIYEKLESCSDFNAFYDIFKSKVRIEIEYITKIVNGYQENNAKYYPDLIRTLTIDDCIDKGELYNYQGARYTWSLITMAALANTADSLYAIKNAVFDEKKISAAELVKALHEDYIGFEDLLEYIKRLPKFGNDIYEVDCYAKELSHFIAIEFRKYTPYRGGKFLTFCNTYWIFDELGKDIGATPDGRRANAPIADSAAAVAGRDVNGPTALINSVTALDHLNSPGTLVFNIRFTSDIIKKYGEQIRGLIETFIDLGGTQMQINTVDQKLLEDAMIHPEDHMDLIVRVAGYSEYFNRLSLEIRKSVLERIAHEV